MLKVSRGTAVCALLIFLAVLLAGCGPSPRQSEVQRVDKDTVKGWLGDPAVHRSHQSALVRKDPDHYRPLFPDVPDDLPYVWPASDRPRRLAD